MRQQRQHPKRERSRGVAALELALSLVFLMPLLLSTLDYGYYFYIGSNAEDAARAGVRQAVRLGGGAACGSAPALPADATGETPAASPGGVGCTDGSAYCYMNEPPLGMGGPGGYTTVTLSCAMVGGDPNLDDQPHRRLPARDRLRRPVDAKAAAAHRQGPLQDDVGQQLSSRS